MNQDLENVTNEPAEETTPVVNLTETTLVEEATNIHTINSIVDEDSMLESVEELPDYTHLSKIELLQTALKASNDKELGEALNIFKAIKPYLDHLIAE